MENAELNFKRKADDVISRDERRAKFMIMEAKNKLRKLNNNASTNENPISDDSSHSNDSSHDDELDLNLSLALPGQSSNKNTTTSNNNNNSSSSSNSSSSASNNNNSDSNNTSTITSSKNSRIKKPRRPNNPSTSSAPAVAVAVASSDEGVVWPIRKQLSESDVTGRQNRLFIEKKNMSYIMDKLNDEEQKTVSEGGFQIPVVDNDTGELKRLKFSYWKSTKSYVLNGEWQTKFVDERKLKVKDIVGLRWDDNVENCNRRLIFSVLNRASPSKPNESSQEINTLSNSNESSQDINTPSNSNESSSQEINTTSSPNESSQEMNTP